MENKDKDTKGDLFSQLPKQERKQAEANFQRYADLVMKIYKRMSEEDRKKLLFRLQWEKRNKGVSQNI